MAQLVNVHLLPSLVEPEDLAGSTVVVIDVLRASTTIIHALAAGAVRVVPCLEVDEAKRLAARIDGAVLLGGERRGTRIDGFDLGNSPTEYSSSAVKDKTIVFTTTNGTQALMRCRAARRVLIGAFVNLSAICVELAGEPRVDLLCAGTDGEITREDVLFAGAVVGELSRRSLVTRNDKADIALDAWQRAAEQFSTGRTLAETLRHTQGGRNLIEIGHERDIAIAAEVDRFALVPQLDLTDFAIRCVRVARE